MQSSQKEQTQDQEPAAIYIEAGSQPVSKQQDPFILQLALSKRIDRRNAHPSRHVKAAAAQLKAS